ncbi:M48 family metalloprotease [Sulfuricaulis sp.]|uniref:beta-barrel assembly-enhancing protease n=1 Tax=Sulfuricaulis sp. TaxID=2003553 RepID=UPI0025E6D523|nr:M48 family metalloprotease [Sulfuricaulis sp.]
MLRTTWRVLLAASLLYPTGHLPAYADNTNLPDLGDESIAVISPAQERKLGEDLMRQARRTLAFMNDPEISEYIQSLGQRLVSHSDNPKQDFRFFVIDNPSINAFAVPGGFIGVHTGLILATQSEAELASVLAHETAHITQRHIPRLIAESQRTTLPALAAVLAGILLASSGHQGGEAAIALTSAAVAQKGINYTRTFEEEADRIGMQILAQSGFDPRAMPAFFEQMQNLNRLNDTNLPEFLRTHPVTTNRIADSRNRAEKFKVRRASESSDFQHVRAKIRALAPGNQEEIVRGFRENLAQGKYFNAEAERYGYAVALLRVRQLATARAEVQKLVKKQPNRISYRILQAETEMSAENYKQAQAIYVDAYAKAPANATLIQNYASALLKTGKHRQARDLLKNALQRRPEDPELYRMLAQAAGGSGAHYEAHKAMAEHYYLSGNPNAAIEQLQLATRFAGDNFYLQSSLEARMAAIKEEIAVYQKK